MANSEPQIIYEDETVLVVNKPAGMVVNRAQTAKSDTLQDWVEAHVHSRGVHRSGIVHRLDKETSGVMVIAKTPEALTALQQQFKTRQVTKTYVALVYGKLVPATGVIAVPIARSKQNREKFTVKAGGKSAETEYRVKRYYPGYSLVELRPRTGRTHQIRIHLAYMGHPVVGDERYAGQKQSRADRLVEPRHRLEAVVLGFYHPVTGRWMEFKL